MIYDLNNPIHARQCEERFNHLKSKKAVVELTDKTFRTPQQNRYLHLILGWFALESGLTLKYVKLEYFKKLVNPDTFRLNDKYDEILKRNVEQWDSSRNIPKEKMTTCIERFRNWSSENRIYLPSADEEKFLKHIDIEINRNKKWL